MDRLASDERRDRRTRVVMQARLRIIGGKGFEVEVTDLSIDGCSFNKPTVMLRQGQQVAIKLETLDFITASVKMATDTSATILFDRPLYGPVVEHMLRKIPR